ncbi:MAG: DUF5591 domain-containing protein [Candidatus Thermoplasmatota archaeon]|nr:DUF5591 domain-containing protein [Candidatus Thermoplasmatota archaeon]
MIEITERWGLAKKGKWEINDQEIEIPNVFFLAGEGFHTPKAAEVSISTDEDSDFSLPSSFFGDIDEDHTFPAVFTYPDGTLKGEPETRAGDEKVQVIFDQEPDPEAELYILGNDPQFLKRSRRLYEKVVGLRRKIEYHKLIYAPGIATPKNMALLSYLGVDFFDSSFLELLATDDVQLSDWMGFPGKPEKSHERLLSELFLVRKGIKEGRIRELVESRVRTEPWMVEVLRMADEDHDTFSKGIPVTGDDLYATTRESLNRPDIRRYRRRLRTRYEPPERDVLLLLPCSARKPYFQSRTHRRLRDATQKGDWTNLQEVVLTSPLGAVPRELELFYPAQQYDIPVSDEWFEEEKEMILEQLDIILNKGEYDEIISHLPPDMSFVPEEIDCLNTSDGERPTSSKAIDELAEAVRTYAGEKRGDVQRYLKQYMTVFTGFQFGGEGKVLLNDADVKGRYPWYKIMNDNVQRGMLVPERGLISLTLDGAKELKKEEIYQVEIDDFTPKGSVFAVGVKEASERIRPEDEAIVVHDDELRGVGPASMSGQEMMEAEKGEAVRLRHYP